MRRLLALILTIASCLAIACGAEVRFTPTHAQDQGGAGGVAATGGAGGSEPGQCDCPAPPPPRLVELARAECVGGFASFGITAGELDFRDRGFSAWLHPTADETLGQQQGRVEWDPERGVFVRCRLGEEVTATLWGLEAGE